MTDTITTADLTIDHGTGQFGPTATITVNAGPLTGYTFTLRSTEHMDDPVNDLSRGGGIHLSGAPGPGFDWRGAFRTYNMGEAIEGLVEYVNKLAPRRRIWNNTSSERFVLQNALDEFEESLNSRDADDDPAVLWRRVLDAVAAMDARIREATVSEEGADRA